ncbi:MAG TPA: PA2779 family protein [Nevskiaceae bacterium]|nr:PA2779 family protein [Nevskiaceae bacterium]
MQGNWKRAVAGCVTACVVFAGNPAAYAGMVGTEALAQVQTQADSRAVVDAFLARADVKQQLVAWGVAPEQAESRVASLSESELQQLAQTIGDQPAGGDVLVVVGVVFIVLLILELVGVTNIFTGV